MNTQGKTELACNRMGAIRSLWLLVPIVILSVSGISLFIHRLTRQSTPLKFDVGNELYPRILNGDDARSQLSGTWVLTGPSLKRVRELIGTSSSEGSPSPTIDSLFMIMLMTGAKACYDGANDCYIGVSDVRYFEKGKPPLSGGLAHPNRGGPQGGMLAHMFTWRVVNQPPECASTWSKKGTVRSWLIQTCEITPVPGGDEKYVYLIVERNGKMFLRGTSPFSSEGNVEFMEWSKLE